MCFTLKEQITKKQQDPEVQAIRVREFRKACRWVPSSKRPVFIPRSAKPTNQRRAHGIIALDPQCLQKINRGQARVTFIRREV